MVRGHGEGADVVGGMPHWESGEDDQREHVRLCFDLAERHDADVDMHVDETDDGSCGPWPWWSTRPSAADGRAGSRSGTCARSSAADEEYAASVVAGCARAGITVVSNPVTNLVLQGRATPAWCAAAPPGSASCSRRGARGLRAGLREDGFYPFGRGDLLEVALVSAHAAHLTTQDELRALAAVTRSRPAAWRLGTTTACARRPGRPAALRGRQLARGAAPAGPAHPRLVPRPEVARTTVQRDLLRP